MDFSDVGTIVAGVLGAGGSLFFIITYIAFPEERTQARRLIWYLSICDLVQAVFCALHTLLSNTNTHWGCLTVGAAMHFAMASSATWTTCIAIFVYLTVSNPGGPVSNRVITTLGMLSWGLPLLTVACTMLAVSSINGELSYMYKGVCLSPVHPGTKETMYHWLAYRMPLVMCFITTMVMYFKARQKTLQIRWVLSSLCNYSSPMTHGFDLRGVALKFTFVPVVFLLTRGWGTLLSTIRSISSEDNWCPHCDRVVFALDASQGFFNFIFFVIGTKQVRERWMKAFEDPSKMPLQNDGLLEIEPQDNVYNHSFRSDDEAYRPTQPFVDAACLSQFKV